MARKGGIRDDRQRLDRVVKRIRDTAKANLSVGVHGSSPSYVRGQSAPVTGPQVAAFNEFGTLEMYEVSEPNNGRLGIPERSFIRSTVDDHGADYDRIIEALYAQILDGKTTAPRAMKGLGLRVKSDIQRKIVAIQSPPNTAQTIERKGSSNPLIDDSQLKSSITYEVK